jgi:hypothetical protein
MAERAPRVEHPAAGDNLADEEIAHRKRVTDLARRSDERLESLNARLAKSAQDWAAPAPSREVGLHDDEQIHVALVGRRAVGLGAKQDDLVRIERRHEALREESELLLGQPGLFDDHDLGRSIPHAGPSEVPL